MTLVTSGSPYDEAIVAELKRELGIDVRFEGMESGAYFDRLAADPPAIWVLGWVADYPGPNDFLGLLLGDRQLERLRPAGARPSSTPRSPRPARRRTRPRSGPPTTAAETIVQRDVPVVPVSYEAGYALARDGLLGATESGLGILRLAGLAWASP